MSKTTPEDGAFDVRAADRNFVWRPYTAMDEWLAKDDMPVVTHASGAHLYLDDGRAIIDGVGSWWVSALGHNHPRVIEAMHTQLDRMAHVAMAGLAHEPGARVAAKLVDATPPGLDRVFFSDNGSTAVEVAVRAAFQYWRQNGRPERRLFVSLSGAYHGDTIGTFSVGGIDAFHEKFRPLLFETVQAPSPSGVWYEEAFDELETILRARCDEVAAVIVEPLIQGAAGMLMYPPAYLQRLRALCDELDLFLIADEVFVGFGRTGTLFACEQAGITPDFMCLSKVLTAGTMPFAVTMTTERVFDGFRGDRSRMFHYGHSYCGNPLGAAAACAVLDVFAEDGVLEHAARLGDRIERWLEEMRGVPGVVDARRTGTVTAVQMGEGADYDQRIGWRVYDRALADGAYMRPLGNVSYLVPALTMPEPVLDELLEIAGRSIRAALAE